MYINTRDLEKAFFMLEKMYSNVNTGEEKSTIAISIDCVRKELTRVDSKMKEFPILETITLDGYTEYFLMGIEEKDSTDCSPEESVSEKMQPLDVFRRHLEIIRRPQIIIEPDGESYRVEPTSWRVFNMLYNKTFEELWDEYLSSSSFGNSFDFLSKKINVICIRENTYIGKPNEKQIKALMELKQQNLYQGKIYLSESEKKQ